MTPTILLLILVIVRGSPVGSAPSKSYSEKITPKVDFGSGTTWAVRFQLTNKQFKNMCNARLTVPTDLIKLYTERLELDIEIQFLLDDKPLSQLGSMRVSNFKQYTNNPKRAYAEVHTRKLERAKSQLLRSMPEYHDAVAEYKPVDDLYFEFDSKSSCARKIRSRRSTRAIQHARARRDTSRSWSAPSCRRYELVVDISEMYQSVTVEPSIINVGTCINPQHKMHPKQQKNSRQPYDERVLHLRSISQQQCTEDYDNQSKSSARDHIFSYRNIKEHFAHANEKASTDFSRSIIPAQCFPKSYENASIGIAYHNNPKEPMKHHTMMDAIIVDCGCH
ncbi:Oidioi.mRNA.OKI2018_I69.XSR.g14541.t1.cds [Oikopleura dioica]|uniref:Oidioi.mRNA.OKI2018_I69.XSR.g14541.t1.cds n=1 Tax=Oikopleura dioica TaxID=34765 RepID=A0ABN7SA45_OIKDI|nr:Oidioi.mRNA.OKI2018_I69.XSR.g14541.t1.cds [Oikopleura dioica]